VSNAQRRRLLAVGICKRFSSVCALEGVSLSVAAGEVHGLLSANGTGKSTLIGVPSGAIEPDSGALRVVAVQAPANPLKLRRTSGRRNRPPLARTFWWCTQS
jgi:ribose transport system ATP-binding protein